MSDTDRIDLVTGVRYTGRMIHDSGNISYFSRTADGRALGTVFFWAGKWSSVYDQDGKHRSLRALSKRMILRRASDELSRVINAWMDENSPVVMTATGMSADQASDRLRDMIMALDVRTAS